MTKPIDVTCTKCSAEPGEPCGRMVFGVVFGWHTNKRSHAERVAAARVSEIR